MSEGTDCEACGLASGSGRAGCEATFNEVVAREFADFRYGRLHRTTVDAYALQHPDRYCASGKSFAAHLTGLCCAVEYGNQPSVHARVRRWLDGPRAIQTPPLPGWRGSVTIGSVAAMTEPTDHLRAVEAWARDVWDACGPIQPLAREWIRAALT
ncbi:MAG: DUF5946 family protein [Chloroflexota bacterium]|nr:DUF5946 family protein [Chloroflexota bacterium]